MKLHMIADEENMAVRAHDENSYEKVVKDIKNMIDTDIYAVESVEQLAREFKISSGHMKNIFKKHTGITIFDYLFEKRMKEAKRLLEHTDLKVYEIAEKLGYKSRAFFSKAFQKSMGFTPSEYRKRNV